MDVRFCPNCGEGRRDGATYCVACGNRLVDDSKSASAVTEDVFAIPPSILVGGDSRSNPRSANPVKTFVQVARLVTAFSPILAVLYFDDLWLIGTDLREIWTVSVLIPALMTAIPVLGARRFLGIFADDARFVLLSSISAFFVALRAIGALIEPSMPNDGLFVFSQLLGMMGFAVVGLTFPWRKPIRTWFAEPLNPVHISVAMIATIVFLVMREQEVSQFLFSPGSISGPTALEYVFLIVLACIGFLRSPWRQFAALPIASFSILSYLANVLFSDGPIRPWPNPVTFACCIALCFPWESAVDPERQKF